MGSSTSSFLHASNTVLNTYEALEKKGRKKQKRINCYPKNVHNCMDVPTMDITYILHDIFNESKIHLSFHDRATMTDA